MKITNEENWNDKNGAREQDRLRDARALACIADGLGAILGARPGPATVDEARSMVADVCVALLTDELRNDPEGRGYAGKTDEEAAQLVNDPYSVTVDVIERPDPARPGETILVPIQAPRLCRVSAIFNQVPYAPNAVSVEDVAEARR